MKKVDLKKRLLREYQKFPKDWQERPWFLALSGGEDSTVLAHVTLSLRKQIPPLHFLHVNYHLRLPQCDQEEHFLERWAKRESIPFWVHRLYPKKKPANLQDWARRERYQFFLKTMELQAPTGGVLLTAHHQGDQVETILSRCLTGGHLEGMAGMEIWEDRKQYAMFRPLIEVPKDAISLYRQAHELKFFQDRSNRSQDYLRNRIRLNLVPWLKRENPQIEQRILQWGQTAGEAFDILHSHGSRWLQRQSGQQMGVKLPLKPLLAQGVALRRSILAQWLKTHWGNPRNLGKHLQAIERALKQGDSEKSLLGPGDTLLKITKTTIEIKKRK